MIKIFKVFTDETLVSLSKNLLNRITMAVLKKHLLLFLHAYYAIPYKLLGVMFFY